MIFIKLYLPLICAITLFILAFRLKIKQKVILKIRISFAEAQVPITNRIVARTCLIIIAALFLYYYLIFDISAFFPSRLKMEVFYDKEGIRRSLSEFSADELHGIGYSEIDDSLSNIYYQSLDRRLKEILSYNGFFSLSDGIVHSSGDTIFVINKLSGIHNYKILEARGELLHVLEIPNKQSLSFKSYFDLFPTSHDYLRPNLSDCIINNSFILKPRFKQIIAENNKSSGILFDHTLVGLTKVIFLPWPHFSNTVYLFQYNTDKLVPIGYAVYQY